MIIKLYDYIINSTICDIFKRRLRITITPSHHSPLVLQELLDNELHGQHIVKDRLVPIISAHYTSLNPSKVLNEVL